MWKEVVVGWSEVWLQHLPGVTEKNPTTLVSRLRFELITPEQWRTEGGFGVFNAPSPLKFQSFDKAEPNSQFRGKYIRNNQQEYDFHSFFELFHKNPSPPAMNPIVVFFFSPRHDVT